MTTDFQVTLKVDSRRLATVLEALAGSAQLVSVLPCEEETSSSRGRGAPGANKHYAGGKRNKGITGRALVLKLLRNARAPVSREELARDFEQQGFARNSFSPPLSELRSEGLVELTESGRYRLKKEEKQA